MADKAIGELTQATQIYTNDLFVLSQSGVAKQLSGQLLMTTLASWLQGHGGIKTIAKASTSGLTDTYTITYADNTTSSFDVTNGAQGPKGDNTYLHIKYAVNMPDDDADMLNTINNWIGIYSGDEGVAPAHYQSYAWYRIKGETGNGISAITYNSDTSVTIEMTDGESVTTSPLLLYPVSMTPPSAVIHGQMNYYTMALSDNETTISVPIYAGQDGAGGDMFKSVYDSNDLGLDIYDYVKSSCVGSAASVSGLTVDYDDITALLTEHRTPSITIGSKVYTFSTVANNVAYFVCVNTQNGTFDWISVTSADVVSSGTTTYITNLPSASTGSAGIVQLTDSTSSTSTSTAATPNSVKSAYDLASEANIAATAAKVIEVDFSTEFSSLPQTFSSDAITGDMVCVNCVLSNSSAQVLDWTVNTADGIVSVSGSTGAINGSTTMTLYLSERTVATS